MAWKSSCFKAPELRILSLGNVADDQGGQYVDDGEHEEVPHPPDLEHCESLEQR